ncbi:hypothetical protein [Spirillospora sp. NBC_01491]|uniref:hypothetical protein n=1 Tax=Spirillospora sp. NBC_01491 TaxID=2976007 RepID=UPI002E2FA8B8|nr:hypothetical protein [Spirillospora sp. NBC_01491]
MDLATPGARAAKLFIGGLAGVALIAGIVERSASPWTSAWSTAVQRPVGGDGEDDGAGGDWSRKGFSDQSVRQIVRASAGGERVRIRLSNVYGTRPLRVAAATVGRAGGGAAVWPESIRDVTFGRTASAVVPAGREAVSDPVPVPVSPMEGLAVTLRFTDPTGPATFHRFAAATSYRAPGDHLADTAAGAFSESSGSWYYLSGVEVAGRPPADLPDL